jgi:hypothetical protein
MLYVLNVGINDAVLVLEERGQTPAGNVAILVDGRCENGAAMFPKPSGIVSATAKEGNSERGTRDNHDFVSLPTACA